MARTGRPPTAPPLVMTPTQRRFYAWLLQRYFRGSPELLPDDPHEAFRVGIALGRQYQAWFSSQKEKAL